MERVRCEMCKMGILPEFVRNLVIYNWSSNLEYKASICDDCANVIKEVIIDWEGNEEE